MPNKPLILFVDDEAQALKYFAKTIEDSYNVITALNASDARKLLNEHHEEIAVLISDQRMPTETGVQLLEYTRVTYPRIVRLLTTAYSDLSSAIDAVNTGGIYWYVNKPWNGQELKSVLKRSTEYYYLQRDREQLMKSKANIFQHILLSDRTKSLLLLANQLQSTGWLRTGESLEAYLSAARDAAKSAWNMNDTLALELRDVAERECRFLIDVNESINPLLKSDLSNIKQCDLSILAANVIDDIAKSGEFEDVQIHLNTKPQQVIASDEKLLKLLFKSIISRIANMDGIRLELFVDVGPSSDGSTIRVSFSPRDRTWSSSQFAALFSAGIPSIGGLMGLDMDLLPSYFIAGHLGGQLHVNAGVQNDASISVELPTSWNASSEHQSAESSIQSAYDHLEQWIEHVTVAAEM